MNLMIRSCGIVGILKQKKVNNFEEIRGAERGERYPAKSVWVALGYPASYSVAASSLGFQTVYRTLNEFSFLSCERFFYSDTPTGSLVTMETGRPVPSAAAIGFSLACETDLLKAVQMLQQCGISPLSALRSPGNAPVIVGGPLTLLDPKLVALLADVVVCGEGEDALPQIAHELGKRPSKAGFLQSLGTVEAGIWIPSLQAQPPVTHRVALAQLPAYAATWSPLADFRDLFLVEIARGCPRRCAFCLLANTGRFRAVSVEQILSKIPADAPGVGLVGAAVTDHPALEEIVSKIVSQNKRVSLSSMRADRLTPSLLKDLVRGGLRSLTVAADGSSARIRKEIHKGITEEHLLGAAQMARENHLQGLKLYSMVGLPGETDEDVVEFASLANKIASVIRLTVAIQSFVPKPGTPLQHHTMASPKELKHRLALFQRLVKGKVMVQSSSARWSWVDWKVAHSGEQAVPLAIAAAQRGGDFGAWKQAVKEVLSDSQVPDEM